MKKKAPENSSLFSRLFLASNLFAALLLLLCYLTPWISPASFPYFALMGLLYPFLVVINLLFFLYWLARGKWLFLISLACIILGINHLLTHLQFHFRSAPLTSEQQGLKIVSYNVHLFGLYDWRKNIQTRDHIFSFLETTKADVYCFQEFFDNPRDFPTLDTLKTLLETPYVYANYFLSLKGNNHFGLAIFSRYPILDTGRIQLKPAHSNYSIFADIQFNGKPVRVYNNHLESIRFNKKDYLFYEDFMKNPSDQKDVKTGSISIFKKLALAYRKRSQQVEVLGEHLGQSPYPVIVCGDFNDTPLSYTYRKLSDGLKDAFVLSGLGMGRTYAGVFPSYRIDYILFSPDFQAVQFKTHRKSYSDHYPISVVLAQ